MRVFAPRLGAVLLLLGGSAVPAQNGAELREPSAFSRITDAQARSRALFTEAAKVIMHPRCVNCHPASDRPTQGDEMHQHLPTRPAAAMAAACPATLAAPVTAIETGTFSRSGDVLPEYSRPSALALGAARDGVGRKIDPRNLWPS